MEIAQHPPPLSAQHLPSSHGARLNAQGSAVQLATAHMAQHLQHGQEMSSQQEMPPGGRDGEGYPVGIPNMREQHSAGTSDGAQNGGGFQEAPWQKHHAGQRAQSQHMHSAAGLAQQQQQGISYHVASDASYASHAIALGIPAAHMHSTCNTGNPAHAMVPSLAMPNAWMPPAVSATGQMLAQLPFSEQQDAPWQQQHQCMGQAITPSHLSGMLGPMPDAQLPASNLAQPDPAISHDSWQEQQVHRRLEGVASAAPRRARAPPGFPKASRDMSRPLQEVLSQLQMPGRSEQQGWAAEVSHVQQPLSPMQDMPMPWLPLSPANGGPHFPAPGSGLPSPGPAHSRLPQPHEGKLSCHHAMP